MLTVRALLSETEQVNTRAVFQPVELDKNRPTPFPLDDPMPPLPEPLIADLPLPNVVSSANDIPSSAKPSSDVIGSETYPWAMSLIPTIVYQILALANKGNGARVFIDVDNHQPYIIGDQPMPEEIEFPDTWTSEIKKNINHIADALKLLDGGDELARDLATAYSES